MHALKSHLESFNNKLLCNAYYRYFIYLYHMFHSFPLCTLLFVCKLLLFLCFIPFTSNRLPNNFKLQILKE